jgi:hypothetical protein
MKLVGKGTGEVTAKVNGSDVFNASSNFGFKNRLINSAMVIDQRNAGAAVTVNAEALFFGPDRFRAIGQASPGVYTLQRVTDAPAGFVNSAKVTVTTADASLSASDRYFYQQVIEGNNVADLNFGLSTAQTITVSFWVKSSLTGSFGGSLYNNAGTRSYPYSYTISVANTWEYKTITIAGDTTGTWPTDNTGWGRLTWSFGSGSTFSSTAGSWQAGQFEGVTGQVQLISTLNATFYITGVQLEKGSTATSFDFRSYGTELALCQRYYQKSYNQSTAAGTSLTTPSAMLIDAAWGYSAINTIGNWNGLLPVAMRTNPTLTVYDIVGNSGKYSTQSANGTPTDNQSINYTRASENQIMVQKYAQACSGIIFSYTVSAEL